MRERGQQAGKIKVEAENRLVSKGEIGNEKEQTFSIGACCCHLLFNVIHLKRLW
jgi:hypothetical protein